MSQKTNAQKAANLQAEVRNLISVYNSNSFMAIVEVVGETPQGEHFKFEMVLDNKDPEFKTMINDYAARKSAEVIALMDADKNTSANTVNLGV